MPEETSDRRSQRTCDLLLQALLELMDSKTYDLINVQDIVQHANVGRSTFYAHFQNKDDLLIHGFDALLEQVSQQITLDELGGLQFNPAMLFQHASGHYELYRTLIWGSGLGLLVKDGQSRFSQKVEERLAVLLHGKQNLAIPLEIFSTTFSGSLLVMLKWWLDHKMPYSPETMAVYFQQMLLENVNRMLENHGEIR
jgi:AcrR family transcriptional regulator